MKVDKFDPSTGNLRWRPVARRGDLEMDIAFDPNGRDVHRRFRTNEEEQAHADRWRAELHAENRKVDLHSGLVHVAHLTPLEIVYLRDVKGINIYDENHGDALRRILNDPEYRKFRTTPGRF
jgi:hypothetical protein